MFGPKSKDSVFFDAFSDHAKKSVDAAKLLVDMFVRIGENVAEGGPYRAGLPAGDNQAAIDLSRKAAEAIKALEKEGDTITHQTVKRLHETWITPLDREDIHELISRLDDVLDMIEAVSERVMLFDVTSCTPDAAALARVLVRACDAIYECTKLLPSLSRSNELLEKCVEINRLENEADGIYRKAIAELFKAGNDPLTVMKWRDIFDNLETATDRCEDVANIMEGVVLEYA